MLKEANQQAQACPCSDRASILGTLRHILSVILSQEWPTWSHERVRGQSPDRACRPTALLVFEVHSICQILGE
jgi:hypothetical protein